MTVIIDYQTGNVGSIRNMLKKIGYDSEITNDHNKIKQASKLILPGVGHFDRGMKSLDEFGLIEILNRRVIEAGVPVLGVCLGMQLLTNDSEEGSSKGLGWIDAHTLKFKFSDNSNLRIPHMGWNSLSNINDNTLFEGLNDDDTRFYFVHSYHVQCTDASQIAATTQYGYEFHSSVRKNNIFGTQFHPEKSHKFGMRVYKNFLDLKI